MATSISFSYWYTVTGGKLSAVSSSGTFTILDLTGGPDGISVPGEPSEISVSTAVGGSPSPAIDRILSYNPVANGDVLVSNGTLKYLLSNDNSYPVTNTISAATKAPSVDDYTYCFLTGTKIATPNGEVTVETLQVGDEILTHTGATAKVRFNFVQKYHNHFFINKEDTYPICIKAGALADNVPSRDLYVTPDHAIYFPEWNIFANALTLVNGTSIYQMRDMPETFTYYHILCDNQEIVLAENTPAETFIDNVSMETFDNYAEYAAMYPQEHEMIELDIPRGKSDRQLPRKLKQDIANRAATLYPMAQAA